MGINKRKFINNVHNNSVSDYSEKGKKMNYKDYRDIFEKEMSEGIEIFNSKGEIMPLIEGERWKQCYNKDDNVRKDLPKSWFISDKTGNVVSTARGKCKWLIKVTNNQEHDIYSYSIGNRTKTITVYALVGIVFDSPRIGKAKEKLAKESVYAFGTRENPDNVQAHHIKNFNDYPEMTNSSDNIEFLTVRGHNLVHQIPSKDADDDRHTEFMGKLSQYADEECPDKFLIAFNDGKERGFLETKQLTFSQDGINSFIQALEKMKREYGENDEDTEK